MPRPIFDVEQYELRGIEPEVFTDAQREDINKATARAHGQIDWTAQLLGFNGPKYWGRANPKSDFSYNFVGLPETMDEKRQMQTGAFGVFNKHLDYEEWPAPFNRSEIKASADAYFHIWEDANGKTRIAPLGQGEDTDYLQDPALITGGSYIFDAEIEVEILLGGDQSDEEPTVDLEPHYGDSFYGSRLNLLRYVDGSLVVKRKKAPEGTEALALEVSNWRDISDWTPQEVSRQFLGAWGNKGNQLATDFLFDSLSLHSADEHFSVRQIPQVHDYSIDELLAMAGLERTGWTGLHPEKFIFRVDGCDTDFVPDFPVLKLGVGNPWYGNAYWAPTYLDDKHKMDECQPDCNTWVKSWQLLEDELYDNGDFAAFLGLPAHIDYDNDIFANAPQADSDVDDFVYNNDGIPNFDPKDERAEGYFNRNPDPPDPSDPDAFPWDWPVRYLTDATFDEFENASTTGATFDVVDEGIYDRMPFSGISGFEFTWEALTAAAIINPPCLTWVFDAHLDNGEIELVPYFNVIPPYDPNGDEWQYSDGPWATANDGTYDDVDYGVHSFLTTDVNDICDADTPWKGFDDGVYNDWETVCECIEQPPIVPDPANCRVPGCEPDLDFDCYADGGVWTFLGPPDYDLCDCQVECCLVDNETWDTATGAYLGPNFADNGVDTSQCLPADPPPIVTYCDPEQIKYIRLFDFSEVLSDLRPSVNNSFKQLRVWNNHVLTCTDTVPTVKGFKEYRNFLTADTNRGPNPEDSYRHHVRMPLEYVRNGKEWSRATQVCDNQHYFSSPSRFNEIDVRSKDPEPRLYDLVYGDDPDTSYKAVYHEDYLTSTAYDDFSEASQGAYESAQVVLEKEEAIPYTYGLISEYSPFASRQYNNDGSRRGEYYVMGQNNFLTGHLSTDLDAVAITPITNAPTYDESPLTMPNITFPENEARKVIEKNYLVGYAYFAADFSASEEAVFDPTMAHCWRNPLIDQDVEDSSGECVFSPLESNTAYLLHPIELDYGQRTRTARLPGEASKAQGTYDP